MKALWETLRPALLWTGLLVCMVVVFHTLAVAQPQPWSAWHWLSYVSGVAGLILPFAAFAGGIALVRKRRHRIRRVCVAGLLAAITAYALSEFVSPLADYAAFAPNGEVVETRPFGPRTPLGTLRQLSFVEANPPREYTLGDPARTPPNRVRLLLHLPLAMGAFALLNTLLGLLTADLTRALPPPARRNTRFAIGLAGGLAYFAAFYFACHPDRDWLNVSGVLAAWLPLVVPLVQAVVFTGVIRHRKGLLGNLVPSAAPPPPAHGGI